MLPEETVATAQRAHMSARWRLSGSSAWEGRTVRERHNRHVAIDQVREDARSARRCGGNVGKPQEAVKSTLCSRVHTQSHF